MNWRGWGLWLPPVGAAAAGALVFCVLATVDDPTTDRAERIIGGTLAASPFLLVAFVQLSCVLYVEGRTGPPRTRGLLGLTTSAALGAVMVIGLFAQQVARGYPWTDHVVVPAVLTALLLLPLPVAWMARGSQ